MAGAAGDESLAEHVALLLQDGIDNGGAAFHIGHDLLQALDEASVDEVPSLQALRAEYGTQAYSSLLWDDLYRRVHGQSWSAALAHDSDNEDGEDANSLATTLLQGAIGQRAEAKSMKKSAERALRSDASDEAVSEELVDLLGFDHLDLIAELIASRHTLAKEASPRPDTDRALDTLAVQDATPSTGSARVGGHKPYTPGSQVIVQTAEELADIKRLRAEQRKAHRHRHAIDAASTQNADFLAGLSAADVQRIRDEQLMSNAARPLFSSDRGPTSTSQPEYPHVFSSATNSGHGNIVSITGAKFALPVGTTREESPLYEEVTIPPPKQVPFRHAERLIPIQEMEPLCRPAFPGYKSLNRLQSAVYPLGYGTSENLLVCAPTGAGKTDVAMLTVLRTISQYSRGGGNGAIDIARHAFKIVYVAPMKALAAEVVRKFSKRLAYLGIKVREFTGDMQLTRQEIVETQMIVTTPEKWDVATRKPTGEGELATKVKLLIIDEVHLLHEDRGAVIETIVARTLRLVESSQSLIRIVGLSATLPNYIDVADFLRVNRYQGLFYFDSSFRPVPLEQHFIGVKGKANSPQARTNLDKATFEKAAQLVQDGHQVMVFVHARKETVKTAQALREAFHAEGLAELLTAGKTEHPSAYEAIRRDVQASRNREMKELLEQGFGIHHAGMLRADRNISERAFEQGITKILCCTATLAWGVNLPAFAVLIKGTDVYDSGAGKFVDLSILDVLQIFGRAGRPQYEDLGVGYILTAHDKLDHYVDAITAQHPIESKFESGLTDALNAEIALGTVTSVRDGISWLGYTYLFTRMRRQPLVYGMTAAEVMDDPHLGAKRLQLIQNAIKRLESAKMLVTSGGTGGTSELTVTDLGRIAARYYIPSRTIEIFNEKLRARMSEADVLHVLSMATDFEQIIMRDSEEKELKALLAEVPCDVPGGIDTSQGKVNILLQSYISKKYIEDFALVSDSAYVAQNAGRIVRALLEIAMAKNLAPAATALISMSKAIEKRIWPFEHPLAQSGLPQDTLYNLTRWADEVDVQDLRTMSAADIGKLIHLNERLGGFVRNAARQFPTLQTSHALRPLSNSILRLDVTLERDFEWSEKVNGGSESFFVWVQDETGDEILQSHQVVFRPQTTALDVAFHISLATDAPPNGVTVRWVSDRWIGAEESSWVSYARLHMPAPAPAASSVLNLPLLPVKDSIQNELVRSLYLQGHSGDGKGMVAWNALQTQAFHSVAHTKANLLIAAPVASGKSTLLEMAIWRLLDEDNQKFAGSVLHLSPHPDIARASYEAFTNRGSAALGAKPRLVLNASATVDLQSSNVLFTTPRTLLRSVALQQADLGATALVILEDLHLLDASYEVAVAQLQQRLATTRTRWIGTTVALQDASALSQWLNVKSEHRYCFEPRDRPSPLNLSLHGLDVNHSLALLKAMVKPAYDKIKQVAPSEPTIIFVPSRTQCAHTAQDLITRLASELDTEAFLGASPSDIEGYAQALESQPLAEALYHGIAVYHGGLSAQDQALAIELFRSGVVRVLIAPRETCWALPVRAKLVIIMGTQYVRLVPLPNEGNKSTGATFDRKTVDYPMTDLIRMQSYAVRRGTPDAPDPAGECLVLCQSSARNLFQQVLNAGLPLSSELILSNAGLSTLIEEVVRHIQAGTVKSSGDVVDLLSWTFLYHDMRRNPTFYDARGTESIATADRLSDLVDEILEKMQRCDLVLATPDPSGREASGRTIKGLTSLAKVLHSSRRPGQLGRCITLWHTVQGQPLQAHLASLPVIEPLPQSGLDSDEGLLGTALEALRLRVPSEHLAAFGVPRPSKAARKAGAKARAGLGSGSGSGSGRASGKGKEADKTEGQAAGSSSDQVEGTAGPSSSLTSTSTPSSTAVESAAKDAEEDAAALYREHVPRLLLASFFSGQHPESTSAASTAADVSALRKRRDALVVQLLQRL